MTGDGRSTVGERVRLRRVGLSIVSSLGLLVGCVADEAANAAGPRSFDAPAVAITTDVDGAILWASLDGEIATEFGDLVASVDVSTDGQRGLVGLAVLADGRLFAGAVAPDERLVVLEIDRETDDHRTVWNGPPTVRGGNGGRLIATSDGDLVFGVGLLNDRAGQADPAEVAGKLIRLDPDGPPDQEPTIESGPWNNPFAFDEAADGSIWVADNHPQDGEERLARGDDGFEPKPIAVMPPDSAPSGLATLGDDLIVCSYNTGALLRYDRAGALTDTIADDCLLDVATIGDGLLAYSTGQTIVIVEP